MSKDLWLEAHDKLITEYMERHPDSTWEEAYDRTVNQVDERAADLYAAMIDWQRMEDKHGE